MANTNQSAPSSPQPEEQNHLQVQSQQATMEGIYRCLHELTTIAQRQNPPPQANEAANNAHNMGIDQEARRMNVLKEFLRQRPPIFLGNASAMEAEKWFRQVIKVMNGIGMAEGLRVEMATYLFEGEADHWWQTVKRTRNVLGMDWGVFEEIFYKKYFTESVRDKMTTDFLDLQQGNMSVAMYESKFSELSRYADEYVNTEVKKCKRFENGLKPAIKNAVAPLRIREYGELVEVSTIIEKGLASESARRNHNLVNNRNPYVIRNHNFNQRETPYQNSQKGRLSGPMSSQGGRQEQNGENPRRCFECNQPGHFRNQCPRLARNQPYYSQQGQPSVRPQQRQTMQPKQVQNSQPQS